MNEKFEEMRIYEKVGMTKNGFGYMLNASSVVRVLHAYSEQTNICAVVSHGLYCLQIKLAWTRRNICDGRDDSPIGEKFRFIAQLTLNIRV